jgi:hypothetical protein
MQVARARIGGDARCGGRCTAQAQTPRPPVGVDISFGWLSVDLGVGTAAVGKVVVLETELQPLAQYDNPTVCTKLPLLSHILVNLTGTPIEIYADPSCATIPFVIAPGYGSHVAFGTGGFSA